jgi:hypothetical protein
MARKALARRIAEVLFNEPATRRGAGAATRRAAIPVTEVVHQCNYGFFRVSPARVNSLDQTKKAPPFGGAPFHDSDRRFLFFC